LCIFAWVKICQFHADQSKLYQSNFSIKNYIISKAQTKKAAHYLDHHKILTYIIYNLGLHNITITFVILIFIHVFLNVSKLMFNHNFDSGAKKFFLFFFKPNVEFSPNLYTYPFATVMKRGNYINFIFFSKKKSRKS